MRTETLGGDTTRDTLRAVVICAVITVGLAFDQLVPFWGQTPRLIRSPVKGK